MPGAPACNRSKDAVQRYLQHALTSSQGSRVSSPSGGVESARASLKNLRFLLFEYREAAAEIVIALSAITINIGATVVMMVALTTPVQRLLL